MSLQVWLPCNTTTLQTRGFFDVPTSNWTSSQYTITTGGVIGRCLKTGTSANMNTTYTPDLNTSSFSFGGWFKFVKSEIEPKVIDKSWTSAYNKCTGNLIGNDSYGGLGLIWQTNNMYSSSNVFSYIEVKAHLRTPTVSNNNTSTYQLSFDTWTHIFVVWNISSRALSLYINGELINSVTVADYSDAVSREIHINYGAICSGNGFAVSLPCYIDDIRIYDDALSPLEIKELSQALVCHYKLDDPMIESTTNLVTTVCPSGGNQTWGGHTTTWTVYDNTLYSILPISKYIKADVTYSGSGNGGASRGIQYIAVSPSTTYTYSAYIKTSDNFTTVHANFLYRYEYPGTPSSPGTKILEAGCFSKTNTVYIGEGWYRCWGTFTTNASTNTVQLSTYIYPNKDYTYMIGGWQLEQLDHMTPYILGTRTSDLVCTDSSGYGNDMVFSSGDIKTVSDSARYNRSTNLTNTQYAIAKQGPANYLPTNELTVNAWINFYSWGNPISCTEGGGWNIEQANATNGLQFPVYITGVGYKTAISGVLNSTLSNAWHMITGTCDKDNVKIYIDGELKGTTAKGSTNGITYNNSAYLCLAAEAAGTTPGNTNYIGKLSDVRIYGTALSADDILKLYNVGHKIANNSFGGIVKDELHTYKLLEMEDNATLNKVQLNKTGVARASGMSVNPNMLSSTPKSHNATEYCGYQLNQSEKFVADQTYTFQFWDVNVSHSGKTDDTLGISVYMGGGNKELKRLNGTSYFTNGHADYIVFSVTISSSQASHADANNLWLNIYNSVPSASGTRNLQIGRWKMEKGSNPTPWVPYSTDTNYMGDDYGFIEDENNGEIKTRFYQDCITANRFKEF